MPALNAIYDIVGFDPRGVEQSDPLGCLDTAGEDALIAANLDPRHPEDLQQSIVLLREEGEACLRTNPRLARHVTTVETAKDLDVLRAVVGDDSLNYFGASYGTYLGATYAALFPERVGRLVLDGAVDPSLTPEQEALNAAEGFQTAFEAFADDCLAAPPCALGSSRDEIVTKVSDLITGLHAQPLKTDDPERPLTQSLGYLGIIAPLYAESALAGAEPGARPSLRRIWHGAARLGRLAHGANRGWLFHQRGRRQLRHQLPRLSPQAVGPTTS